MLISEFQKTDVRTEMYFSPGKTTVSKVIQQLEQAVEDIELWRITQEQRHRCLYWRSSCSSEKMQLLSLGVPEIVTTGNRPSEERVTEWVEHKSYVQSHFTEAGSVGDTIFLLSNSQCVIEDSYQPFVLLYDAPSRISGIRSDSAIPINDLYFYDVSTIQSKSHNMQNLQRNNIRFEWQPISPYLCLDYAYDHSMVYLADWLLRNGTDGSDDVGLSIDLVGVSEVFADTAITDRAFERTDSNLFSTADTFELLQRTNSLGTEGLLGLIDELMHTNVYSLSEQYWNSRPIEVFLLERLYFPALLLTHNQTVPGRVGEWYVGDPATPQLPVFFKYKLP